VVAPVFVSENVCDAWDWTPVTPGVMWRLLLMSDGHLEGHLQVLARGTLRLELVETALALEAEEGGGSWVEVPAVADGMAWPRRRRQVRLVGADGVALVHATSVWDAALYDRVMGPDEGRTIWEALHAARFGTARRVLGVRYGRCAELGRVFGCEEGSMMWSREVLLKRERRPMVVVSEILSPRLEEYVGPMTAPTDGYFELLARNIEEISVS
jgi:chorismate lyase